MLKLTDAELARVRVEALKLANAANPESTTFRANLYEEWLTRDNPNPKLPAEPAPGGVGEQKGLLGKAKQTLGLEAKTK